MAKIVPLFSSSQGNSYYISGNNEAILVDAGRNCKQLELALLSNEIDTKTIKAIFVTHEHTDHCSALRVFAKRYDLPIYATKGTLDALVNADRVDANAKLFAINDEIVLGDMLIKRVNTSHDAKEPCGYSITTADNRRCAVVTDTGFLTNEALTALKSCNLAVIESNHDIEMLKNGPYPYILKQRVLSMTGHLSNVDCAKVLPSMIESGVTRLLLAHLSQENNTKRLAVDTSVAVLSASGMKRDSDYTIDTAPVETNGKAIVF
ncbi:MAG: MBL fold metallo-hydrolase [Ruminococcus sp.]|nr:MBL fold metallo-hydrolase [Ruminococcus sp.]